MDLLERLRLAIEGSLEASHHTWDSAFRVADDDHTEKAAWEAKVSAMQVQRLLNELALPESMLESGPDAERDGGEALPGS